MGVRKDKVTAKYVWSQKQELCWPPMNLDATPPPLALLWTSSVLGFYIAAHELLLTLFQEQEVKCSAHWLHEITTISSISGRNWLKPIWKTDMRQNEGYKNK